MWHGRIADGSLWGVLLGYAAAVAAWTWLWRHAGELRDASWRPAAVGCQWGLCAALVLLALLLAPGGQAAPFIYFQF